MKKFIKIKCIECGVKWEINNPYLEKNKLWREIIPSYWPDFTKKSRSLSECTCTSCLKAPSEPVELLVSDLNAEKVQSIMYGKNNAGKRK